MTTLTDKPSRHELWNWAARTMSGAGASTRSGHRAEPTLHLLAEGNLMWCSGGKALPWVPIRPRYCSKCMTLAREMWDEYGGDDA